MCKQVRGHQGLDKEHPVEEEWEVGTGETVGTITIIYNHHKHNEYQLHVHKGEKAKNLTPWILFTIFVFGPCEPLIPLLIYPAAKSSTFGLVLVTGVFGVVTIATMLRSSYFCPWEQICFPWDVWIGTLMHIGRRYYLSLWNNDQISGL